MAPGEIIQMGKEEHDSAGKSPGKQGVQQPVLGGAQTPKALRKNSFAVGGFGHFYYLTPWTMGNRDPVSPSQGPHPSCIYLI